MKSVIVVFASLGAVVAAHNYECVDEKQRCKGNWCNLNCHGTPRYCPPSFCRLVSSSKAPPPAPAPRGWFKAALPTCPGTENDPPDSILGTAFHEKSISGPHKLVCCPNERCGGICGGPNCGKKVLPMLTHDGLPKMQPIQMLECCPLEIVEHRGDCSSGESAPCVLGNPPPDETVVERATRKREEKQQEEPHKHQEPSAILVQAAKSGETLLAIELDRKQNFQLGQLLSIDEGTSAQEVVKVDKLEAWGPGPHRGIIHLESPLQHNHEAHDHTTAAGGQVVLWERNEEEKKAELEKEDETGSGIGLWLVVVVAVFAIVLAAGMGYTFVGKRRTGVFFWQEWADARARQVELSGSLRN